MTNRIEGVGRLRRATALLSLIVIASLIQREAAAAASATAQAGDEPQGSIRGVVYDKDFEAPLAGVSVTIVETGAQAISAERGNYVFNEVAPGRYTLTFAKSGYTRRVRADVLVTAGELSDVDVELSAEFTEMEEFVVEDILQLGVGTEASLLALRFDSPSLLDSVSADLMSRAGAGDAASALRLVSGASVQDGRFAVIRGLPDRYVSSQLNGVRLPSADEDTRAVELDQFPAAVIESIQVSKTFTPDQQGDASGGAVDVRTESIPGESILELKLQVGGNTQTVGEGNFLTYEGGGIDFLGLDGGGREQQTDLLGQDWEGAVGVSREEAPEFDYKASFAVGGKHELDGGGLVGGFLNLFYERQATYFDDGVDDTLWVESPGDPLTPQMRQVESAEQFLTALYDVEQGAQLEQWGGLGSVGFENENHFIGLSLLTTHTTEDKSTLAEDTRGKEFYFGPDYDPNDPLDPGNSSDNRQLAPYQRLETLEYTERMASSIQLTGRHVLPIEGFDIGDAFAFRPPELGWTLSSNTAALDQPDKRLFGSIWLPPTLTQPGRHIPLKSDANFLFGNLQRIWKEIEEESQQASTDLRLPFEQWGGVEGYLEAGVFVDRVERVFDQDTFSNFNDNDGPIYIAPFEDFWSAVFPTQGGHPITAATTDVDYDGEQAIDALYGMFDLPLSARVSLMAGARYESTDISIVNDAEVDATWIEPGESAPSDLDGDEADVDFEQEDLLPALALRYDATDEVTLRASYAQTVARQTFKELSPILQQEYLGGPVFIGNPELGMAGLDNFDLRLDYRPEEGSLVSASWFYKDIADPIETVQRVGDFSYTTAVNYPEGELSGWELEVRQHLGRFSGKLDGLSLGANATFIDSEVTLPDDEAALFDNPAVQVPMKTRDATNAPEHLYNLYLTYDLPRTRFGLFYTVRGDALSAGATVTDNHFVPSVYDKQFGTLSATVSRQIASHAWLTLQGKNLTNPEIEQVYRSDSIEGDVTRSSYTAGREFTIGISVSF